jgi:hypothetical protein
VGQRHDTALRNQSHSDTPGHTEQWNQDCQLRLLHGPHRLDSLQNLSNVNQLVEDNDKGVFYTQHTSILRLEIS